MWRMRLPRGRLLALLAAVCAPVAAGLRTPDGGTVCPSGHMSADGESCASDSAGRLPGPRVVSIGIVGFGRIGRELGAQLKQQREELAREGLELVVVAVARSRSMWLASEGEDILGAVMPGGPPAATDEVSTDLRSFGEFLLGSPGLRVAVDCTADDAPAELFADWLAAGISVVTANKRAGSGPLGRLAQIREAAAGVASARFLYEAIYIYIYIYVYLSICLRTYTSLSLYIYIYPYVCMYVYIYIHMCVHLSLYTYIHIYTYVCMCVYIYTHVYIYI